MLRIDLKVPLEKKCIQNLFNATTIKENISDFMEHVMLYKVYNVL